MRTSPWHACLDLVLPATCGGCGRVGALWCAECAAVLTGAPARVWPRVESGVPCWALGPYRGPARRAVLTAKERGRRDLIRPLGVALARGLEQLRAPRRALVLVPAPSRRSAARRRGGDPVTGMADVAARSLVDCRVAPLLSVSRGVRDSVGLSPQQRLHNLRGRVMVDVRAAAAAVVSTNTEVVVLDDVLTTGATAGASVGALASAGFIVTGVLTVCAV